MVAQAVLVSAALAEAVVEMTIHRHLMIINLLPARKRALGPTILQRGDLVEQDKNNGDLDSGPVHWVERRQDTWRGTGIDSPRRSSVVACLVEAIPIQGEAAGSTTTTTPEKVALGHHTLHLRLLQVAMRALGLGLLAGGRCSINTIAGIEMNNL